MVGAWNSVGALILSLSQWTSNRGTEALHTASDSSGTMSFLKTGIKNLAFILKSK